MDYALWQKWNFSHALWQKWNFSHKSNLQETQHKALKDVVVFSNSVHTMTCTKTVQPHKKKAASEHDLSKPFPEHVLSRHLAFPEHVLSRHLAFPEHVLSRHLAFPEHVLSRHLAFPEHVLSRHLAFPEHVLSRHLAFPKHVLSRHLAFPKHVLSRHLAFPQHVLSRHLAFPKHALSKLLAFPKHVLSRHLAFPEHVLFRHLAFPEHVLWGRGDQNKNPTLRIPFKMLFSFYSIKKWLSEQWSAGLDAHTSLKCHRWSDAYLNFSDGFPWARISHPYFREAAVQDRRVMTLDYVSHIHPALTVAH